MMMRVGTGFSVGVEVGKWERLLIIVLLWL